MRMAHTSEEQHTIDIEVDETQLVEDELHSSATDGNPVEVFKNIFEQHREDIINTLSLRLRALRLVVITGDAEIVEELVEMMSEEELDITDSFGKTTFYYAVAYGQIRCVLLNKKPDLATTLINKYGREYLPIEIAAANGHDDMMHFLYEHTKLGFGNGEYHIDAFSTFIDNGCYHTIASLMLSEKPELAIQPGEDNSAFLDRALRLHPHLANEPDDKNHTLFHVDEYLRREREEWLTSTPKSCMSVAELLASVAIAALFNLSGRYKQGKAGVASHIGKFWLLFEKEHEELRREAEKWLKNTADTGMFVATLMTIVSFLAGLSAPQNTRMPIFLGDFWFKAFAVSNAITFIFSASSVLFFLSILTSTFSMNEFRISLPFKLLLSLFSLSTSILAMMLGCFAALFGIFKHPDLQYPYLVGVAVVGSIPVLFLAQIYLPLFYHVFRSTPMSFLH